MVFDWHISTYFFVCSVLESAANRTCSTFVPPMDFSLGSKPCLSVVRCRNTY